MRWVLEWSFFWFIFYFVATKLELYKKHGYFSNPNIFEKFNQICYVSNIYATKLTLIFS
jgi:hypothetical protein